MNKTLKTMLTAMLALATLCGTAFAAPRPPKNAAPARAPVRRQQMPSRQKTPKPAVARHHETARHHDAPRHRETPPPPRHHRHHGGTTLHTGDWVTIGAVGVVAGLLGAFFAN